MVNIFMRRRGLLLACALAALAYGAAPAQSADEDSTFNRLREKYSEKKVAAELGERVLTAARPKSSGDSGMVSYTFDESPKEKTAAYSIKMKYTGAETGTKYVAEITVTCDTSRKHAWEVTGISLNDPDNPTKPFKKDVDALRDSLNASK